jgi:hypothetical protein
MAERVDPPFRRSGSFGDTLSNVLSPPARRAGTCACELPWPRLPLDGLLRPRLGISEPEVDERLHTFRGERGDHQQCTTKYGALHHQSLTRERTLEVTHELR